MPAKNSLKVTPSSGNVFRDLGFSEQAAEHLVIRADLLIQIQKVATARRLKQARSSRSCCRSANPASAICCEGACISSASRR
jgi:hypothetical protein